MKPCRSFALSLAVSIFVSVAVSATAHARDALAEGFANPPAEAKPRVWWHWISGNVSEESIRLDLQWMKRIGIGGVQSFDVSFHYGKEFEVPLFVEKSVDFCSPEWRRLMRYSVELADQLHLEFAIASSAGWSETGGPWVTPQQAMKKLVWSEMTLNGGRRFQGRLPQPPDTTGLFQNMPLELVGTTDAQIAQRPKLYADIAAIAYRAPDSEVGASLNKPAVTSSAGAIDADRLSDGDLAYPISLPFEAGKPSWIELSFSKPQRVQSMTFVVIRPRNLFNPLAESGPAAWLEVSEDGRAFRKVVDLPRQGALQQTVSFPPTAGKQFRVMLEKPAPNSAERRGLIPPPTAHQITELALHSAPRVNRFEDKAGFSSQPILDGDDTPALPPNNAIAKADVVDLTSRLRADGSLDWTPPPGKWTVLRFGYSLTGRSNHPASAAATGFEVDKLNRQHVKDYVDRYIDEYQQALGSELIGRRGLQYLIVDSYEAGAQNWTEDFLAQFKQRRGYDALLWLPVLAGRVVDSAATSDRFLWDFRRTLGDLIAEAHYDQIGASLREHGMRMYGESHENGRAFVGDGMRTKKAADIPTGAMWAAPPPGFTPEVSEADIRESASVAHVYGKNIVAAESLTAYGSPYRFAPQDLKPIADRELSLGLNQFIIHTSAHQSDNRVGPGIGLGPFGQWFTRKETWAEQATPWISYLTRSSYLLQQGRRVADIAYLYGEDTNVTTLFKASMPPLPRGLSFDFVNSDVLLNELTARDGALVTRAGASYRVLVMDASTRRITVPLLRKIRDLIKAGARVVGARPEQTPSLEDRPEEFHAIVDELWGAGGPITASLKDVALSPDLLMTEGSDAELRFVHRALESGELYFIVNDSAQARAIEVSLRVHGRKPELWRADTATIMPTSYRMTDQRTLVPLKLAPHDALFLVFREPTTVQSAVVAEPSEHVLKALEGAWEIAFPPDRGAPETLQMDPLRSWTEVPDPRVKYFSGTATYRKTVVIRREWLNARSRLLLDLGQVKNLAEVVVNGRSLSVLWNTPFRVDITHFARAGNNRIEIKVTNLWPNRLIGDKQPNAQQIGFATYDPFKPDSALLPSGLLGPVSLLSQTRVEWRSAPVVPTRGLACCRGPIT